jgi:hypothetical protein
MRRTSWSTAGSLLLLAALAGCRDGVVSPAASPVEPPSLRAPAPASLAPQGRPTLQLNGGLPDSAAVDFVVGPMGGVFFTGNHAVVFPAQSICDPATSSYGPGTWDAACSPLQTTLNVHAEVRHANGVTSVDFTPSLRFVPSSSPTKWVWMFMYAPEAVGATDLSRFNILWASRLGGPTVDEAMEDPSLRTYVDTFSGISLRRIKHFSGYQLGAERNCGATECAGGEGPP